MAMRPWTTRLGQAWPWHLAFSLTYRPISSSDTICNSSNQKRKIFASGGLGLLQSRRISITFYLRFPGVSLYTLQLALSFSSRLETSSVILFKLWCWLQHFFLLLRCWSLPFCYAWLGNSISQLPINVEVTNDSEQYLLTNSTMESSSSCKVAVAVLSDFLRIGKHLFPA